MKKTIAVLASVGMASLSTSALAFNLNDVNRAMEAMNSQSPQGQQAQQAQAPVQQNQQDQQGLSSQLGQFLNLERAPRQQQAAAVGTTGHNLGQASQLISQLTDQLGVSQTQAIGGSAALLAAAKNQLGSDQFNQLSNQAPGVDGLLSSAQALSGSQSMLSKLSGMGGNSQGGNTSSLTSSAFSMLGMDAGMVSQFAPVMLNYLGQEGVSSSLLGSLGGIWGNAGR
ncbi:DUF2780 domain-containing protein [Kushneria indalinina]|uniref:Uncharacterized protein VcgC/VcgE DUF2780 n=1 Tax=Kushneria indalinina DSM 14324 TaxID=1122140 RepID=A0A3D9DS95_9GAMM|nr:DUF2780 domain-containing protein [Kushneria indalinina]REC93630.1 uncharacterized protein VcgC/VcgE DUF2780 [Kushneria indalinina DSM 14324]